VSLFTVCANGGVGGGDGGGGHGMVVSEAGERVTGGRGPLSLLARPSRPSSSFDRHHGARLLSELVNYEQHETPRSEMKTASSCRPHQQQQQQPGAS